ncbi:MAG: hypothetical protein KDK66_04030, partial [Deltaproteobacteria bacterium]|nr:hypothetical protein [Deltaproteobacteria bacterium]
ALVNLNEEEVSKRQSVIQNIALDDLQVAFEQLYQSAEQIHRSEVPKVLWDLLLVKLVHGAPFQPLDKFLKSPSPDSLVQTPSLAESTHGSFQAPKPAASRSVTSNQQPTVDPPVVQLDNKLKFPPQIQALLDHAIETRLEEGEFIVIYEKGSLWLEMLQEKRERLAKELEKSLGQSFTVRLQELESNARQEAPAAKAEEHPLMKDPTVREAVKVLGAQIVQDS